MDLEHAEMESKPDNVLFMKGSDILMTDPGAEFEDLCGLAHNEGYYPVKLEQWLNRNSCESSVQSPTPSPGNKDSEVFFVDDCGDVLMTFPWLAFDLVRRMAIKKGYKSQPISKWLRRNERGSPRSPRSNRGSPRSSQSPRSSGTGTSGTNGSEDRIAGVAGGIRKPSPKLLFTHLPLRFFRSNELQDFLQKYKVEPTEIRMWGRGFCESLRRAVVSLQSSEDSETVMKNLRSEYPYESIKVLEMKE